jgi:hypothetical protein
MGDDKQQEIVPVLELKGPEEGAQGVVEFIPSSEIRAGFYEVLITGYHQSVN